MCRKFGSREVPREWKHVLRAFGVISRGRFRRVRPKAKMHESASTLGRCR